MEEVKAIGRNLQISTKQSVEICNFIRNKSLKVAKNMLNSVVNKKIAVPYKRYRRDVGHKAGMASGRYPITASKEILKLINSVEKNAENHGLNVNDLTISYLSVDKGASQWHFGRKRRRKMKNTNIEIKVKEIKK